MVAAELRMSPNYSLWLMPRGELLTRLAGIIEDLSLDQPALHFEPHVTLLGGLTGLESEVISKTRMLATTIQPYEIHLDKVGYFDEFFRCLFIRVEPTLPVLEANQKARQIFQRQQDSAYLPHLSLRYGRLASPRREQIIGKIGSDFHWRFEARAIHLYSTEGEPHSWHRLTEFPLQ